MKIMRGVATIFHVLITIWFIGIISFVWYWSRHPALSAPSIPIPVHNAFDDFTAAGDLMANDDAVAQAAINLPVDQQQYTLATCNKLLSENAPAMARLQLGLSRSYVNPTVKGSDVDIASHGRRRSLARLLLLDATVKARQGNFDASLRSRIDAVKLGVAFAHDDIEGLKIGAACESIGLRGIASDIPHLNANQAKAAAKVLEQTLANTPSDQAVLQEEKWRTLQQLHQEIQIDWARQATIARRAYENAMLSRYSKYMDTVIRQSSAPYSPSAVDPPVPNWPTYLITKIAAPQWNEQRFHVYLIRTQNATILTELSLQAYNRDHGRYPETLNALPPDDLPAVPQDPFANHAPLKYQRRNNGYLLYSVGPDTKDDGGVPIITMTVMGLPTKPEQRHHVWRESSGDIVAGVN